MAAMNHHHAHPKRAGWLTRQLYLVLLVLAAIYFVLEVTAIYHSPAVTDGLESIPSVEFLQEG